MFWSRRGWKPNMLGSLAFVVMTLLLFFLLQKPWEYFLSSTGFAGDPLRLYLSVTISTLCVTHWIDRLPLAWSGLGYHPWMLREIVRGWSLGLILAMVAWVPSLVAGEVYWHGVDQIGHLLFLLLMLILLAAGEELIFRGYLFQRAVELFGPVGATLVAAVGFAAAHLGNPEVSWLALINIFLASLFFSALYLCTGSLWSSIACHAGWNCMLALGLGLPVSGIWFGNGVLISVSSGPNWLSGGVFGPEGGVFASLALILGGVILVRTKSFQRSPWIYARIYKAFATRQPKGKC